MTTIQCAANAALTAPRHADKNLPAIEVASLSQPRALRRGSDHVVTGQRTEGTGMSAMGTGASHGQTEPRPWLFGFQRGLVVLSEHHPARDSYLTQYM